MGIKQKTLHFASLIISIRKEDARKHWNDPINN